MEIIVRYFVTIALDLAKRARYDQCRKRDKNQQVIEKHAPLMSNIYVYFNTLQDLISNKGIGN
jgi:hypothetical protein